MQRADLRPPGTAPRNPARRGVAAVRPLLALVVLVVLAAVTAWNLTRSDALEAAERAFERGNDAKALSLARDHLGRRPWSRDARQLADRALRRLRDRFQEPPPARP
jgi:hypothetical protein